MEKLENGTLAKRLVGETTGHPGGVQNDKIYIYK